MLKCVTAARACGVLMVKKLKKMCSKYFGVLSVLELYLLLDILVIKNQEHAGSCNRSLLKKLNYGYLIWRKNSVVLSSYYIVFYLCQCTS